MYEAMQQNQCMETTGKIYCGDERTDHEKTDYDEYQREREELLKESE
jgi:hypothetical protein